MRPRAPRCPTSGAYLDGRYGHVGRDHPIVDRNDCSPIRVMAQKRIQRSLVQDRVTLTPSVALSHGPEVSIRDE